MSENLIESTPSAYGYPLLIKHLLYTPLAQSAGQQIVYQGRVRYTYRDLHERIRRLASGLAELGVGHGSTVAVMDWDSHRYLECYFAVPMMGAVLLTVNVRLSPEQILYTINHANADVLLVHGDFIAVLEGIRDKLETVRRFVLISDEYETVLAAASPDFDFQLVLHTIATVAALSSPASGQRFHRGDVYMPITPMFHVHGWGLPYAATLLGVKQVYPGRYQPELLVELIRNEGVTFSHCVATILHMLLNAPAARDLDLSRWKVIIGGGPLPQGLAKAALERGIDIFTGYGMSETCPILALAQLRPSCSTDDPDEQRRLRCKTGLPVPLVDLRVVDDRMRDVPHDGKSVGEIVVRAPWLTQGYLNDPQASERLWAGGYLHTQDLANVDAEGCLQITDRLKDVIKTGGEWVSSLELESLISQHPGVSEVAVIGIKDDKWGERPMALVVLRASHASCVTEEDIRIHVRVFSDQGAISKYAVPDQVRIVEAIDKTSVGKCDKKALRGKYG